MKKISFLFITILISACAIDATKKKNLEETKLISSISDKYVGIELKNSYQWLGIPYAEPPQGSLRWKAPRALSKQRKKLRPLNLAMHVLRFLLSLWIEAVMVNILDRKIVFI